MLFLSQFATVLAKPWLARLGGPGLVLLGIADNSLVPLTGSMDVLTIWLAAKHRDLWPYYSVMATTGAVLGGYITYELAAKGGRETIERRLHRAKAERLFRRFGRWGFRTVAVSAILPPPFPMVPVLLAAGALQYPRKKFLGALALGRGVRYTLIAGLASLYGRAIQRFFAHYYKLAVLILVALALIGVALSFFEYLRLQRKQHRARESLTRAA